MPSLTPDEIRARDEYIRQHGSAWKGWPDERPAKPPSTLTTSALVAALRLCFNQAPMIGLSIADYLAISRHNRKVSQNKSKPSPTRP